MIKIEEITLQNEYDLMRSLRHSFNFMEQLGFPVSAQTTFASAISEISRYIINQSGSGSLTIGLEKMIDQFLLKAEVKFNNTVPDQDVHLSFTEDNISLYKIQELGAENIIGVQVHVPPQAKVNVAQSVQQLFSLGSHSVHANANTSAQQNKSLQNLLAEKEQQLTRLRQLDNKKNEFLAMLSHELKTPLSVIHAYIQIAEKQNNTCSALVQDLHDKIDSQVSKMYGLIQQMLDVTRIEKGKLAYHMKATHLNTFIRDVVHSMEQVIKDHQLEVQLDADVMVHIDPVRMDQVLSNLIQNAAKYSEKNTRISIETMIQDQSQVILLVRDEGRGMSDGCMKNVFDMFYRSEDVVQTHAGLGMGLYIASRIVAEHGGKIWAESVLGKGSVFYLSLPWEAQKGKSTCLPS